MESRTLNRRGYSFALLPLPRDASPSPALADRRANTQRNITSSGMNTKVRVALVGAGLVSNSHAQGYLKHPAASIVAVCDRNRAVAAAKAQLWGVEKIYTDFDEMLKDSKIDAVDIMTPPYLHHSMVIKAVEAGKHVNCEKPFCLSVKEGKEMACAAKKNKVVLAVDESYVFTSSHIKAREWIQKGMIGEPAQLRMRLGRWTQRAGNPIAQRRMETARAGEKCWRDDPVMSGGGPFPWIFDHGVHIFATARYLMLEEEIGSIYALKSCHGSEDTGRRHPQCEHRVIPIITWQFKGGRKHGVWMQATGGKDAYDYRAGFSSAVLGTEGMIEVLGEGGGNLYHNGKPVHLVLYKPDGEVKAGRFEEGGDQIWDSEISYYDQAHINQVTDFIDSIRRGKKVVYGAEDGINDVKTTLAAIKSALEERPVKVEEVEDQYVAPATCG